ncbi:MAG TPA: nuclear transport factor 2 family protein [Polyangiaceae bacterium]|nr:nuclear transport factor 2 family protein [Polyangiaceae bacterium]
MLKLYFSPLACSLATRIALYEANAEVTFVEVDAETKLTEDGQDFLQINPLGMVPTLELPNGKRLSENSAVLQYVARAYPDARLAPRDGDELAELQRWLSFIGSELHKALFTPLLVGQTGPDAKAYALGLAERRLGYVAQHLAERNLLLDRFSVADAYLFTILNWSRATPVDLKPWPALVRYQSQLQERSSVARALREEFSLYERERARRAAPGARSPRSTAEVIARFNAAFQEHDPTQLEELIADDCVLENTQPAPLGARHVGREACLELWRSIAQNRDARFQLEEVVVAGDRAQIYWHYVWGPDAGDSVRGVNLMRVREGRIVEARGYVKGS